MITVGIYIEDQNPQQGGASSLLTSINSALQDGKLQYKGIILYRGGWLQKYKTEIKGTTYINIDAARRKWCLQINAKRFGNWAKNVIKSVLLYNSKPINTSFMDRVAKEEHIDVIWFTCPTLIKTSVPYIYTIWDLGHRVLPMFPEVNDDWNGRETMYQEMVYHASYIITGSQQGKKEIIRNYNVEPDKVRVVPFPVSSFCKGEERSPENLPSTYFFYPAQFWPHKNHIVILKALEILKNEYHQPCSVVFTGSDKGNKAYIEQTCEELGIKNQVCLLGFVSYEEIKYLYTHAVGQIFSSLMGPNNLPPIEAASLGCPVIITDLPGHKEQLGDSALYFNGKNERQLAECMMDLLLNRNNCRDSLKAKMKQREYDSDYTGQIGEILEEFSQFARTWKNVECCFKETLLR